MAGEDSGKGDDDRSPIGRFENHKALVGLKTPWAMAQPCQVFAIHFFCDRARD